MAIITIFLRGGADGLSLVAPVGDDAYHRLRPTTRLATDAGLPLDARFRLHPDLAPLRPWWDQGQLAVFPAAGIPESSRSHFVAQDWLEQAGADSTGGWLGRWLATTDAPLAAVAMGRELPLALRGASSATALQALAELTRPGGEDLAERLCALAAQDPLLAQPSRNALEVHRRLGAMAARPRPAAYGASEFAGGLANIAGLIHADVGLRAACIDLPGWDSHIAQESVVAPLRRELAAGLAALAADLGPKLATTSILVFTEFGRRCAENASLGTDHGRAGCAFVIGGGGPAGLVGGWPGLDHLEDPGDLPVVDDLRGIFAAALRRESGPRPDLPRILPGWG